MSRKGKVNQPTHRGYKSEILVPVLTFPPWTLVRGEALFLITYSQWASIAVEAEELIALIQEEVEASRRAKISEARQTATPPTDYNTLGLKGIRGERARIIPLPSIPEEEEAETETRQLIAPSETDKDSRKVSTKLATTFNTNRTYINEAAKIKRERPFNSS